MNNIRKLNQIKYYLERTSYEIFHIDGHGNNTKMLDEARKLIYDIIKEAEALDFEEGE